MINHYSTKDKGRIIIEGRKRVTIHGPNGSTVAEWEEEDMKDPNTCAIVANAIGIAMADGTDTLKKRLEGGIGI